MTEDAVLPERRVEQQAALRSVPFEINAFTLFESHLGREGALHEAIADYRLHAP